MSSKDCKENGDKEGDRDRSKRRRLIKTDARSSSPVSETRKITIKTEIKPLLTAKGVYAQEEEEVMKRAPETDVDIQKTACQRLQKVILRIQDRPPPANVEDMKVQCILQMITLKKLNRQGHVRCKKAKEATAEAKHEIEQQHLHLQNLLYEVTHLQKEINKCLQFKSKDEEINLVSVDDFYENAPESVSRPAATKKDLHQQTLARLDWELQERKRLMEEKTEMKEKREQLGKENSTKLDYLDTLQPKLAVILQATKPVQEYLDMPFDDQREQHELARFLPPPLYMLYMHAAAYREACDKNIDVKIDGDLETAKATVDQPENMGDEESDSDTEEAEKQTKKRRRRISDDQKNQKIEKKQKVLKAHPLSVIMTVHCKADSSVQLTFLYLLNLGIVTVKAKLDLGQKSPFAAISAGDLLLPSNLLSCLYQNDLGTESPNPANKFYLKQMGISEFRSHMSEVGHAYTWAQWLGGLQFLKPADDDSEKVTARPRVDSSLSMSHMEGTVKRLRQRVQARFALQEQLSSLERCSISVEPEFQKLFPTKIASRLTSWKRSTLSDFKAVPYTAGIVKCGLAHENDLYFCGKLERGSAKMDVYAVVGTDYPLASPLFAVNINWGNDRNNTNDEHIQDLEAELNFHFEELLGSKSHDQVLTNQVHRLLICFDVYLETEAENKAMEGPVEFAKEKIFTRVAKGPSRKKPYVYNKEMGFFHQRP